MWKGPPAFACPRARTTRPCVCLLAISVFALTALMALSAPAASEATTLPPNFQETTVFSGLTQATDFRFSPDGRVFVAEKSGLVKVYDSLTDTTPTIFADLRTQVHNYWDRGLLGLALDPAFPTKPYVYVYYVYNAAIGGTAPRWPTTDGTSDDCPTPPGPTDNGCVVSSRVSRLRASGDVMTGSEQVLVEAWCQQSPSHSGGGIGFGADGMLYVSGGEGAFFNKTDWGQYGSPSNPCGDPPGGVGVALSPPTTEGGRLRSQDLRTSGDPVGLSGTVIRIDPDTGAGLPDNPLFSSADLNARRIVGYGFRNPFRLAIRPGTNEVWVGDVGEGLWEEVDRIPDYRGRVENFGWPCYQGGADSSISHFMSLRNASFDSLNVNICEDLYRRKPKPVVAPHFAYSHDAPVLVGDNCVLDAGAAISGVAFAPANTGYPATYRNALFFSDYTHNCIWVMYAGAGGLPDQASRQVFAQVPSGVTNLDAIQLQFGPGGDLFYLDYGDTNGSIRRISYTGTANRAPVAVAAANPTNGPAPLTVSFDASGSSDPDTDALTYAWDLDGDGAYDDSTAQKPSYTYTQAGSYTVGLEVTDTEGASDTDSIVISPGNTPPNATITAPSATTTWKVGQQIAFSGSAGDQQDGTLGPAALSWSVILHHCTDTGCHVHPIQDFSGTAGGSFTAPDHEYPSYLELRLTATDSGGLQDTETVQLDPTSVVLTFQSSPTGLQLTVGSAVATAPFTRQVIVGSTNSVTAPAQTQSGTRFGFSSWSDGGAQSHDVIAPDTAQTYTATFIADNQVPDPPSDLTAQATSSSKVDLAWTAATDSVGVTNYKIYRNGSPLTTIGASTSYSDTTVAGGTTYSYQVSALDAAGNESALSNTATATTPGLTTLSFQADADARVEEANATLNFGPDTTLRADGGSDPDVESYLRFNVSGVSGPVQSAKLRLWVTSSTADGPAVYTTGSTWSETGITWANRPARTSSATDDKGVIGSGTWVEYDVKPLVSANGTYSFVLATTSSDGVDFSSREISDLTHMPELVLTFGNNPSDFIRPSAPSGLTARAGDSTDVDLAWTAATDNIGVTNYKVYRGSALLATTGAVTSFSDTTAVAGATYSYQVTALDAAGNESTPSNTATVTTPQLTIRPEADARVEEASPTLNFGTSTRLRVEGGVDPDIESYLRFTVSGVTGTLQSARLRLFVTDPTADGPAVYTTGNTWSETGITWNNRLARTSGATDDKGALADVSWVEYDVKPLVAGNGTYSFVLATSSDDGVNFKSRESTDIPDRPELVLSYGP
jgi:glucose/arabinose dehydrogenase/PKD repeat protein